MKAVHKLGCLAVICFFSLTSTAAAQEQLNTSGRMMQEEKQLTVGGYGQIDFNQPLGSGTLQNGGLDVHRMVLMFGYKFNAKTQFISEIEFEHVKEVYVEQAFLQHEITPWLKFRGGLMLIPMGIINEFHEPSTFNGVERPNLDKYIVPTTWREIGAGFTGVFPAAAMAYQIYILNGFNGFDGTAKLNGANGLRNGRQKGAESFMSSPNVAFRVNHFGLEGLQLGFSGYAGRTQSTLYHGIDRSDAALVAAADSSSVGLIMIGADARYSRKGLQLKAQFNYGRLAGAEAYNAFTGSDLGSALSGWYAEISYDLFQQSEKYETGLIPFIRYEQYNTHAATPGSTPVNPEYNRNDVTFGLGWKLNSGAMLKLDYQVFSDKGASDPGHQVNAGVAVWF